MCRRRRHSRSNHPTITFAPIYPPQKYNRHEFGTMQYSHANTAIHTAFRTQHSEPMKYTSQTYPDRDEIKTGPPPRYSFDEKRPLSSYNQPQTQAAHAGAEHHMAWADMPDDSVSRVNKYGTFFAFGAFITVVNSQYLRWQLRSRTSTN